ncbi:MAG: hypothetical protein IJU40_07995, partial [Desulfovibrionaceae bacterium]|nr:hypothetical protein [Desulfovibrionaceae bacterium]
MLKIFLSLMGIIWLFNPALVLSAEEVKTGQDKVTQGANTKPILEQPQIKSDRKTPIIIQFEGSDSLGSKLSFRLKERLNASNLFKLMGLEENQDEPRLILRLTTEPEFVSRPQVGSIYSLCWVFKEGRGYLPYLLKQNVG